MVGEPQRRTLISYMTEELTSSNTFPDGGDVAPAGGGETDSSDVSVRGVISQLTGKDFRNDDTAAKYVKDNLEFVGKARNYQPIINKLEKQFGSPDEAVRSLERLLNVNGDTTVAPQPAPTPDPSQFVSRAEFDRVNFYAKNPALEAHREIIDSYARANGLPLETAVNAPALKGLIERASAYEAVEKSKSVLQSNPRLGQVTDKMTSAREFQQSGNHDAAASAATAAVLDSLNLK
jgi:hypothetical protein